MENFRKAPLARHRAVRLPAEVTRFDKLAPSIAEQAAERIARGIERGEPRALVGSDAGMMERIQRWFPVKDWQILRPLLERQRGESL